MGSPISGDEGFDEEPFNGGGGEDFGGQPAASDKPFDEEPFDAGVEADEENNPETYIQQLSGKLGQSLRKYTDSLGVPDYDLEKFAINSVLSATNSGEMDQQDQSDIIQKVKSSTTDGTGKKNDEPEEADMDLGDGACEGAGEGANDGTMDLSNIDMEESVLEKKSNDDLLNKTVYIANRKQRGIVKKIDGDDIVVQLPKNKEMINVTLADVKEITEHNPNGNGKTVFQNEFLDVEDEGMEENKYLNLENSKKSSKIVDKENIRKMVKETFGTVEPLVKPQVKPQVKPEKQPRRNKPYRIIPEQLPDPKPKAEANNDINYIKDSGFSEDGNSITIKFDRNEHRFVTNFVNNGEMVDSGGYENPDEPDVYVYETDILEDGKQYYTLVSKFGHMQNYDTIVFEAGDKPEIFEV